MSGRLLLPFLSLVAAGGMFFGYINPTWTGKIAQTKIAIANDDQALAAAKAYTERQNELAAQQGAIDPAKLEQLAKFLPDSVDNVGIILDLNALGARSGVSLSNIDVAPLPLSSSDSQGTGAISTGAGPVGSVDLTLSATGTFASFRNFLRGIEQSQRLLDVRSVIVSGSGTGVYTYQMIIRLYWLR